MEQSIQWHVKRIKKPKRSTVKLSLKDLAYKAKELDIFGAMNLHTEVEKILMTIPKSQMKFVLPAIRKEAIRAIEYSTSNIEDAAHPNRRKEE